MKLNTLSKFSLVAVLLATPATLSLSLYHITKDPSYRPLAAPSELAYSGKGRLNVLAPSDADILVRVAWPNDAPSDSNEIAIFANTIHSALGARGISAYIELYEATDTLGAITFRVGASRIGPMTLNRAYQGISAVTDAHWLDQRRRIAESRDAF
jgi:hypothetical protein